MRKSENKETKKTIRQLIDFPKARNRWECYNHLFSVSDITVLLCVCTRTTRHWQGDDLQGANGGGHAVNPWFSLTPDIYVLYY